MRFVLQLRSYFRASVCGVVLFLGVIAPSAAFALDVAVVVSQRDGVH